MSVAHGPDDVLGLVGITVDQVRFDACVDAGGFGLIYRGYHEGLGEVVAIKALRVQSIQRTNDAIREALAGRFRDETRLLYRLSQGNLDIVRCISSGSVIAPKTKEYTPYMVLEWLDGKTLSAELRERRHARLRPPSLDGAVALLDSAAGALAYAHANDVVHRDVKPGNLFLTRTREGVRMKVLDFGLAKILSDESIGVRPSVETGVGVHFCSPSYGAPEQFTATIGKIGPWTDVYSLTLVLFEVLLGEKVRPSSTLADGLMKAVNKKTGSPTASSLGLQLPEAVEELLARAVAQNPLERPHNAGVFWGSLKEAIATSRKPNLNATVMDDSVGRAMQDMRAAVTQGSVRPAAFTGTLMMQNAPSASGAPNLVALGPNWAGAPSPSPAAGAPPQALGTDPAVRTITVPMQIPEGRLKATLPIGAVSKLSGLSPLASSIAAQAPPHGQAGAFGSPYTAHRSQPPLSQAPLSQLPHSGAPLSPYGQQPQQPAHIASAAQRPLDPRIASSMAPTPPQSSTGSVVFIIVCLALAGAGIAFYVVRMGGR